MESGYVVFTPECRVVLSHLGIELHRDLSVECLEDGNGFEKKLPKGLRPDFVMDLPCLVVCLRDC